MVYESDFYTTRRPYSRPLASSYSITTPPVVLPLSAIIQLRGYLPRMPYIAHKRLVTIVHSPVHNVYYAGSMIPIRIHSRVRPSVIAAELKRIRDLPRSTTWSYTDHYLNSKDHIYFDDEAKEIRARVDSLLRRVHVYIPRATPSDFVEEIVPERMRSGDYVRRLISGKNNTKKDAEPVSWYDVPERGHFGNLACVKYVAGKPQSVRRPYYKVADLRPSDIKNDVNFLSYYQKNRQAAAKASPDQPMTERELRKARALETERTESIVKREVKPTLEKKITAAEEKKKSEPREIKPVAEEKKPEPEEIKPVAEEKKPEPEEKKPEPEEIKPVAEEKKSEPEKIKPVAEEKKTVVEEPVKEEVKPKAKAAKESKVKKSKEAEKNAETSKTKEAPVKEPPKEPELVAESVKEKEVKVEAVPVESAEPAPKPVEAVEEPPKQESVKEEPPKEVPAESEVAQVKEPENVPETKPEVQAIEEPKVESKVEPEVQAIEEPKVEPKVEPEVQAIEEPKVEPKVEPTVEPIVEPEVEPVIKTAVDVPEFIEELKSETVLEEEAKPVEEPKVVEATPASSELVSEKDQPEDETEEVKQEKQDAARRAEEYLRKVAEEARTEEEKRKAAEDERTRLELEEKKAWEAVEIDLDRKAHLDEILMVERAEAERKIEEEKLEKERTQLLRLEEAERQINAEKLRALMEEEERMLIEERAEEIRQRQEREERLAEVARGINNDKKDLDCFREDHLFTPITDQELEEKPYEVQSDEDTRIEEENEEDCQEVEEVVVDPFVLSETECSESRPISSGGTAKIEEDFVWPDEEA